MRAETVRYVDQSAAFLRRVRGERTRPRSAMRLPRSLNNTARARCSSSSVSGVVPPSAGCTRTLYRARTRSSGCSLPNSRVAERSTPRCSVISVTKSPASRQECQVGESLPEIAERQRVSAVGLAGWDARVRSGETGGRPGVGSCPQPGGWALANSSPEPPPPPRAPRRHQRPPNVCRVRRSACPADASRAVTTGYAVRYGRRARR